MQLTSSSILGMPSNSSVAPANSPAASTTQRGVRAYATEQRPLSTLGSQAVVIPPGFRFPGREITYPDLPNGPHDVERQPELLRVPDGEDVHVMKRFVKFVDDPDSLSIIVVSVVPNTVALCLVHALPRLSLLVVPA